MQYTKDNPLKVFTAFSGIEFQCQALDRLVQKCLPFGYELVGWSEIDKYAIQIHNLLYPQYAERNFGDIQKVDWEKVPDFDLLTWSSPCQDWSLAGLQLGGGRRFRHPFFTHLVRERNHKDKTTEIRCFGKCKELGRETFPSFVRPLARTSRKLWLQELLESNQCSRLRSTAIT